MKKVLHILLNICMIIAFTYIGDGVVALTGIPVPGSIIGLGLLFMALKLGVIQLSWVEAGAGLLISEMMLFFVPAIVGLMQHPWLFGVKGIVILFIIISGTALMMITTGIISEYLLQRQDNQREVKTWLPRYFS